MSTIITKNSANSGSVPASLVQGELAINVTDGRLFYGSGSSNNVKEFGVTASYALNALSASYAISASYEINYETSSSYAETASLAYTASYVSGSVVAPGSTTQVIFNSGGVLGANSGFVYSGSRVGIGTTTPSASLHISGSSGSALLEIDSPAVNNILFVSGSGNVGIGTATPSGQLQVGNYTPNQNGIQINQGSINLSRAGQNQLSSIYGNYYGLIIKGNTGNNLSIYSGVGGNDLARFSGGVVGTTINDGANIRNVLDDGTGGAIFMNNVLISTTSSLARLHVRGSGATSATTGLRVENANASASMVVLDNGNVGLSTTTPSASLHISGASSAALFEIDSPAVNNILFVSGSGRVGIGTGTPAYTLDVNGTVNLNSNNNVGSFRRQNYGNALDFTTGNGRGRISGHFTAGAQNADVAYLNVGYNRTSISSGSADGVNKRISEIALYGVDTSEANTYIAFNLGQNTPVEKFRFTFNGNLLIGNTTDLARLHVRGSGATSATTGLRVENANASASLIVNDAGDVYNNGAGGVTSNTFYGENAGRNTTGVLNTFIGSSAGSSTTTGTSNTFLGNSAGRTNSTGTNNTFIGRAAGESNSSGGNNTFVGAVVGNSNTTGANNSFFGRETGVVNSTGSNNSFFGARAAYVFVNGNNNNIFGYLAANLMTNGSNNLIFGTEAGRLTSGGGNLTTIDNSIFLGYGTRANADSQTNQIVIGHNAVGLGSNTSVIGNTSTTLFRPYGNVAIGKDTANAALDISGSAMISGSTTWVLPGNAGGYITPGTDGISIGSNNSGVHIRIRNSNRTALDQSIGVGTPNFGWTTSEKITILTGGTTSTQTGIWVGSSANSNIFKVQGDNKVAINMSVATASLDVAGTTRISGSFNTATSGSILTVIGSGSAQPLFTVQGSQGELFSVTDSLSGSLFSVNDISGLPILEVFSDNTTLMGSYLDPMLITTTKITQTNSGSFIVYSLPTASYDTAFFEYSIKSGSNARAGTIMAIQAGSTVNFTETTTTDIGDTTAVSFTVLVTGSNIALTGSSTSGAWVTKCIIRGI